MQSSTEILLQNTNITKKKPTMPSIKIPVSSYQSQPISKISVIYNTLEGTVEHKAITNANCDCHSS